MDIRREYELKYRAVLVPIYPTAPERKNFPNHTAFGRAMDEYEEAKVRYEDEIVAYHDATGKVVEEFKQAVREELGLTHHPKFEKMYAIAYEQGRSSGLSEVYTWCQTLAPLLQD